jgi:hypothetical protein
MSVVGPIAVGLARSIVVLVFISAILGMDDDGPGASGGQA